MKKNLVYKLFALILGLITIISPLQAAHSLPLYVEASESDGGVKAGLALYKDVNYSEAREQFEKYKENASESAVKKMSAKMKKAYLGKVSKYKTLSEVMATGGEYIWDYCLTDIDKDKKAELLIKHGSCEADCLLTIYRYSKGKAVKVKSISGSHSALFAYPDGNGFIRFTGQMGYETITLITLKNSKVKETAIGARDVGQEDYMYLPYRLDTHNDEADINYSALK